MSAPIFDFFKSIISFFAKIVIIFVYLNRHFVDFFYKQFSI